MKSRIIVNILAAFFFLGIYAYEQEWPGAAHIVEKVGTALNLDQKQFDAVKRIIDGNMVKRKQIWAKSSHGLTLAQSEELRVDMYGQLRGVSTRYQMSQ